MGIASYPPSLLQTLYALTTEGRVAYEGLTPEELRMTVQALVREATLQARMKHPSIVHVYVRSLALFAWDWGKGAAILRIWMGVDMQCGGP